MAQKQLTVQQYFGKTRVVFDGIFHVGEIEYDDREKKEKFVPFPHTRFSANDMQSLVSLMRPFKDSR